MKVNITKDCQTLLGVHAKGDDADLPDAIAEKLINRGFAEVPKAKPKAKRATK